MPNPLPISACIICKNSAQTLTLALDSLAWCDEIILVDSGSSDQTLSLAQNHPSKKVRTLTEPWRGYNPQRHFAASQCKNPWVLLLDADEECSPQLQNEIQSLTESQLATTALFAIPRKNYIAQRYIRCWSPDYQTRLIHQSRTNWSPQPIPEIRTPKPNFTQQKLKSPLLHNRLTPISSLDFCNGKIMEERALILADALQKKSHRATLLQLLTRPALTFLKYYLLKGAFLDGRLGLVIAYKSAVGVTLKYSTLYARELESTPPKV